MFLRNVLLALAWVALTGQFTPTNFIAGFILAYLIMGLTRQIMRGSNYFTKVRAVVGFVLFFIWALIVAGLRVVYRALSPRLNMRPAIIAVPLDVKTDAEITLLANLITLTPGTLSLDVSSDRNVLYIHTFNVGDVAQFRREIKEGFERRLLEVLR
jgi:multicomponent Na+:H+ antiporter subunit E